MQLERLVTEVGMGLEAPETNLETATSASLIATAKPMSLTLAPALPRHHAGHFEDAAGDEWWQPWGQHRLPPLAGRSVWAEAAAAGGGTFFLLGVMPMPSGSQVRVLS